MINSIIKFKTISHYYKNNFISIRGLSWPRPSFALGSFETPGSPFVEVWAAGGTRKAHQGVAPAPWRVLGEGELREAKGGFHICICARRRRARARRSGSFEAQVLGPKEEHQAQVSGSFVFVRASAPFGYALSTRATRTVGQYKG